ncbi:MAG: DUF423 domain-containing protein [Gillisia sp.]
MGRRFYVAGFLFGLIGVIMGAFAAHGLKPVLTADSLDSFETGVRFQMYHALLFILLGSMKALSHRLSNWVFILLLGGIILFSGSIYLLATNSLTSFDFTAIALVTPFGGSLLIGCWLLLLISFLKLKKK